MTVGREWKRGRPGREVVEATGCRKGSGESCEIQSYHGADSLRILELDIGPYVQKIKEER